MQEKDFVTYEYKTLTVKAKEQTKTMDMYEAFGWEITSAVQNAIDGVTLSMRRDRKQKHKKELGRLERQAESLRDNLNTLEKSKTMGASIFAYIFGSVSTLILGGGMCLVLLMSGSVPALAGGIILGLIGLALCGVNYPIYKKIAAKKSKQIMPIIDDNEEKLANFLEKGNDLLRADII